MVQGTIKNLGRSVMLGQPNQGSEVVDQFQGLSVFDWINCPPGNELGTGENSTPQKLPALDFPTGVIAGTKSLSPLFSAVLPGPDDGKVSVESTKVDGMADHITIPVTPTFMMSDSAVILQILVFLETGRFNHSEGAAKTTWLKLEQRRGIVFGN